MRNHLIYLSPHFDDAVLSCGGLIWEQSRRGIPVEVWTICAGDAPPGSLSPQAENCHRDWGTSSAEATLLQRRNEDRAALQIVGASGHHFLVPDCIYRRSPQGEVLYPDRYQGERHPAETALPSRLASEMEGRIRPGDRLVCPMTVGGHLDHRLTREAAEQLGRPLQYYTEIPYLLDYPEELQSALSHMHGRIQHVSEAGLEAWLEGIAAYTSQLRPLFQSPERMQARMRDYWKRSRGVKIWSRTDAS